VVVHFVSFQPREPDPACREDTYRAQDYDCFYASVFENENPALKSLPLVCSSGCYVSLLDPSFRILAKPFCLALTVRLITKGCATGISAKVPLLR
jgi:hypothetical protein